MATKIVNGKEIEMTTEEIDKLNLDRKAAADEYENRPYTEKRKEAYPRIEDQLDMIYWDKVNSTTIWVDAIAAIKLLYPKSLG